MAFADLREFLACLEERGELARVQREVDLEYEIGAICRHAVDVDAPALLFEQIRGHTMPVIANLTANRRRIAIARKRYRRAFGRACIRDPGQATSASHRQHAPGRCNSGSGG